MIRALFVGALLTLATLSALAHDADGYSNWVGGLINPLSGADCCGLNDCKEIPTGGIEEKAGGYLDKRPATSSRTATSFGKAPMVDGGIASALASTAPTASHGEHLSHSRAA